MSYRLSALVILAMALVLVGPRPRARAVDVNVATFGTAEQSTTGFGGAPERAIDGNTNGNYGANSVTHTDGGDPAPWWKVNLGKVFPIKKIVIWNRADCCSERFTSFTVAVLDAVDAENYKTDPLFEGGTFPPAGEGFEVPIPADLAGQTVRIDLLPPGAASGFFLMLAEVQVFSTDPQVPPVISTQPPARVRVYETDPLTLTVEADLADSYQWRRDGSDIPGATAKTYSVASASLAHAGIYSVVLRNAFGETTSRDIEVIIRSLPRNIAPLGIATQSSTGYGGTPERAIDDNTDGAYGAGSVTHSADNDPSPWWEVALKEPALIGKVVVHNRTDCCQSRLTNFRVVVLDNARDEVWNDVFGTDGVEYVDVNTGNTFKEFEVDAGSVGTVVRIESLGPPAAGPGQWYLALAEVEVFPSVVVEIKFRRGDVDGSGTLDITDAINNLGYQFLGSFSPICFDAMDDNDDGKVDLSDAVYSLGAQFLGTPLQPAPGPVSCGPDPTEETPKLSCERACP